MVEGRFDKLLRHMSGIENRLSEVAAGGPLVRWSAVRAHRDLRSLERDGDLVEVMVSMRSGRGVTREGFPVPLDIVTKLAERLEGAAYTARLQERRARREAKRLVVAESARVIAIHEAAMELILKRPKTLAALPGMFEDLRALGDVVLAPASSPVRSVSEGVGEALDGITSSERIAPEAVRSAVATAWNLHRLDRRATDLAHELSRLRADVEPLSPS